METLHIFVTILLASVVFVNADPQHRLPPHKQAAFDACLKKLDLTMEDLHKLADSEGSSEEDNVGDCFLACVDKELGLMDAEGNYDREATLKDFPPFISQEERTKIFDTCLEQKGTNDCETAKLYHICWKKSVFHQHMSPELNKLHDDCKAELSMTEEDIKRIIHSRVGGKTDCFRACLLKRLGLLNQDGTFNKDVYIEKAPASLKEISKKLAEDCAGKVGANDCETAALMYQCVRHNGFMIGERSGPPPRE